MVEQDVGCNIKLASGRSGLRYLELFPLGLWRESTDILLQSQNDEILISYCSVL